MDKHIWRAGVSQQMLTQQAFNAKTKNIYKTSDTARHRWVATSDNESWRPTPRWIAPMWTC